MPLMRRITRVMMVSMPQAAMVLFYSVGEEVKMVEEEAISLAELQKAQCRCEELVTKEIHPLRS